MSAELVNQPIHWVDNATQLQTYCKQWQACKLLAVDTEFMRSQTYYPIAGLLQVNDGQANYLIDPLAIEDCSAFAEILLNPNIVKVLHSCSEDLEVFQYLLGVIPKNLFDTQIAAAAAGYGFSVGFANLVAAVLDKQLPKGETRSDWLQRPLSEAQVIYASIDVEYLYQLVSHLILKLKNLGRVSWVVDDCEQTLLAYAENQNIEQSHLRVKQAWRLKPRNLAALMKLAKWREQIAQQRDVPRNRVIKEHSLLDIAQMAPEHVGELRKFDGISERMIRSDGEKIIELVEEGLSIEEWDLPDPLPRPLSSAENNWSKKLRGVVVAFAEAENIAPELLLKKRDYEALTRALVKIDNPSTSAVDGVLKANLIGWRYDLLAELLTQAILNQTTDSASPEADS